MSIYGGFATRAQETSYNTLLATLIDLLQTHAISCIQNCKFNIVPFDLSSWADKF